MRRLRLELLTLQSRVYSSLLFTVLLQRALVHVELLDLWLSINYGQFLRILLLDKDWVAVVVVGQVSLFDSVRVAILHCLRINRAITRVHFCLLLDDFQLVEALLLDHFNFYQVLVQLILLSLLPGS